MFGRSHKMEALERALALACEPLSEEARLKKSFPSSVTEIQQATITVIPTACNLRLEKVSVDISGWPGLSSLKTFLI